MGSTTIALVGEAAPAVVDRLDAIHAYHHLAAHWADAVRLRLSGPAAYLLGDQLAATSAASRTAAERVATRMADLGAAPTADPAALVERSPLEAFALPASTSDVSAILDMALTQVQAAIREYGRFLGRFRDVDPVSHHLVVELLGVEARRETEIESVL